MFQSKQSTPELIVQLQLNAYNARDIDKLMAIYAEYAELYEHPAQLLARGTAALRERFLLLFQEPNLRATLLRRIVMGNTVVDHEQVTRTFAEGTGTIQLVMIYEVQGDKITKAWRIPGAKLLDSRK